MTAQLWFAQPLALMLLAAAIPILLVIPGLAWLRGARSAFRGSAARGRAEFGLRCACMSSLALALAGPFVRLPASRVDVVFVADASDSVAHLDARQSQAWMQQALRARGANDRSAVVAFGQDAVVDEPLGDRALGALHSRVTPTATNIGDAITLGQSLFSGGAGRRIVVLTDGRENQGDAVARARLAQAAGVQVSVVPISGVGPEVAATGITAPSAVRQNERFSFTVALDANVDTTARLKVLRDGAVSVDETVDVRSGSNKLVFDQSALSPGFHRFTAVVEPRDDTALENNQVEAVVDVQGPPRVLTIEGAQDDARWLAEALTPQGFDVTVAAVTATNLALEQLRQYDAVVLANVAGSDLGEQRVAALRSFVRDFGGALVVSGGPSAFGAGLYAQTGIDDLLPVNSVRRAQRETPSVALDVVIDRSGSMDGLKLDLAKQAAELAARNFQPGDELGVLAFDSAAIWVVPRTTIRSPADVDSAQAAIAGLRSGGGTNIYGALSAAHADLLGSTAAVKHIVLLTDGQSPGGDYQRLLASDGGITVSTIGIGADADDRLLQLVASLGNGRYYETSDPVAIPELLLKETRIVQPPAIVEQAVRPIVTAAGSAKGLTAFDAVPALSGYDAVIPKANSTVDLITPSGDPLLAEWQLGLGKVVAWTSDVRNRWASDWVRWPEFGGVWSKIVLDALPGHIDRDLETTVAVGADKAELTVKSITSNGQFRNGADTRVVIVQPDGTQQRIALDQVAPGEYRGPVPAGQEGVYLVGVSQRAGGEVVAAQNTSYVVGYSPEYRPVTGDEGKLRALAEAGGGSLLRSPAEAFKHDLLASDGVALWPLLVVAAMTLLLAEIAVRRFGLPPVSRLASMRIRPRPPASPGPPPDRPHSEPPSAPPGNEAPVCESVASRLLAAKHRASHKPE